jgi:hypothetical protein
MPIFTGQIIYNLCQFDKLHVFTRKLKAFTEINNSQNIFDVIVITETDSPSIISQLRYFSTLDGEIVQF